MNRWRHALGNGSEQVVGPWRCERCNEMSQYAVTTPNRNRILCKNPSCGFERLVDKRRSRIIEPDGTHWMFDGNGNKWQVRGQ